MRLGSVAAVTRLLEPPPQDANEKEKVGYARESICTSSSFSNVLASSRCSCVPSSALKYSSALTKSPRTGGAPFPTDAMLLLMLLPLRISHFASQR